MGTYLDTRKHNQELDCKVGQLKHHAAALCAPLLLPVVQPVRYESPTHADERLLCHNFLPCKQQCLSALCESQNCCDPEGSASCNPTEVSRVPTIGSVYAHADPSKTYQSRVNSQCLEKADSRASTRRGIHRARAMGHSPGRRPLRPTLMASFCRPRAVVRMKFQSMKALRQPARFHLKSHVQKRMSAPQK